jgi:hypothetical protein
MVQVERKRMERVHVERVWETQYAQPVMNY